MASPTLFYPYVQPDITSCPTPLVRQAIVMAAIDFCERSQTWAVRLPSITLAAGQAAYELELPDGAELVQVLNLWAAGRELKGKSFDEITLLLPDWQRQVGSPQYFVSDQVSDGVEIYPLPDAGAVGTGLLPRVALKPSVDAVELPDFLLRRFADAVAYGAKARLMLMSNQPWTDAALGKDFEMKFADECQEARIEQMHGRVAGSLSVAPIAFGRLPR